MSFIVMIALHRLVFYHHSLEFPVFGMFLFAIFHKCGLVFYFAGAGFFSPCYINSIRVFAVKGRQYRQRYIAGIYRFHAGHIIAATAGSQEKRKCQCGKAQ